MGRWSLAMKRTMLAEEKDPVKKSSALARKKSGKAPTV